jgi:hypothetical protein
MEIMNPKVTKCQTPCTSTQYEVDKMVVIDGPPLKHFSKVAVFFPTLEVVVTEEFLIYDSNTILAAVGGSLGLFLGFSCYHVVKGAVDIMPFLK